MYVYKSANDGLLGSVECENMDDSKSTKIVPNIYLGETKDVDTLSVMEYARQVTRAVCLPDNRYNSVTRDLFPGESDLAVTEIAYSVMKPYKDRLCSRIVQDLRDVSPDENLYVALPPNITPDSIVSSRNNTIIFEQILSVLSRESEGRYQVWRRGELDQPRQIYKASKNVGLFEVDVSVESFNNGAIIRRSTNVTSGDVRQSSFVEACDQATEERLCSICLDEKLSVNQSVLPCGHGFHDPCIRLWMEDTCPICRAGYTRIGRSYVV